MIIDHHLRFGPDDLGMPAAEAVIASLDAHGIHRAVLGPVGRWVAVDNREGNDATAEAIRRFPERLRGYATVNPWYGERAVAELHRAIGDGLSGLKLEPARQGFSLLDPVAEPVLAAAAGLGVPVYVVTGVPIAAEPLQLTELALRWPTLTFIMGRSGRTDFAVDLIPSLSGAPNLVAETAHNGAGDLGRIAQAIGPQRVVFASDVPANDYGLELARVATCGFTTGSVFS